MLVPVDELTSSGSSFDVGLDRLEQLDELLLVVKRGNHNVPSLMAYPVKSKVPHDEPPNAVILNVYPGHRYTLGRVVPSLVPTALLGSVTGVRPGVTCGPCP